MRTALLPTLTRRSRALLGALAISVVAGLAGYTAVAHAEHVYSCSGGFYCASANGPQLYIPYKSYIFSNRVENQTGKGVCDKIWLLISGTYHEHAICTETGSELSYGIESKCEPCEGHGQVERWFQKYTYIFYGYEEVI